MSRIAVTGATGFIGRAIAARLVADGHDVIALGRRPADIAGVTDLRWDLGDERDAAPSLDRVDAVVHAAAHVAPWGDRALFRAVTIDGSRRLLDATPPGARLVLIGSASVYDPRLDHVGARESEAPVDPARYLNEYGRSKAAQERLVLGARPDAIVLRPRAVWGPGDPNLLPRLLARVRGDRLMLPAGGTRPVSATHVSTLVEATIAALAQREVCGPVNVADATPRSAAELVTAVLAAMDRRVRITAVPGGLGDVVARLNELAWRLSDRLVGRSGEPAVTRYAVASLAHTFTLDLHRLHDELGIRPDADLVGAAAEVARGWSLHARSDPAP